MSCNPTFLWSVKWGGPGSRRFCPHFFIHNSSFFLRFWCPVSAFPLSAFALSAFIWVSSLKSVTKVGFRQDQGWWGASLRARRLGEPERVGWQATAGRGLPVLSNFGRITRAGDRGADPRGAGGTRF